ADASSGCWTTRRTPSSSRSRVPKWPARSASTDERSLSTGSWGAFGPLGELVDDDDREREHGQRPERVSADREQRSDRVESGDEDAEPAAELVARPEREGGDHLQHADDEEDPAPGVEAAEDVGGVLGEELRVADRGDAPDDV